MKMSTEDGPALICIPDITGFTRFMAETDLTFSRKIIPPLMRCLVTSNTLSMNVGEIEGDAILFYRFGTLPALKELADQCKKFYMDFNRQLESLKKEFAEDFAKYVSTNKLSLKIILHAAEMTSTHIEGMIKLIGEDVVVVHKLLKNAVPDPEYILLSEKLLSNYTPLQVSEALNWSELKNGQDDYDYIGVVKYRYIKLDSVLFENEQADNGKDNKADAVQAEPVNSPKQSVQQSKEPKV
jgi:hypothetical protein